MQTLISSLSFTTCLDFLLYILIMIIILIIFKFVFFTIQHKKYNDKIQTFFYHKILISMTLKSWFKNTYSAKKNSFIYYLFSVGFTDLNKFTNKLNKRNIRLFKTFTLFRQSRVFSCIIFVQTHFGGTYYQSNLIIETWKYN